MTVLFWYILKSVFFSFPVFAVHDFFRGHRGVKALVYCPAKNASVFFDVLPLGRLTKTYEVPQL